MRNIQSTGYISWREDKRRNHKETVLKTMAIAVAVPCLSIIVICITAILVGYHL